MKTKNKTATDAAPKTPLPASETMKIAYDLIQPDPDQPRKTFSEDSLNELADSIRQQGIVQDPAVEFIPAKFRLREPELHDKEWHVEELVDGVWTHVFQNKYEEPCRAVTGEKNLKDHYRLVYGERRWRAAGIVGLKELSVKVYRNLTREQRFGIQAVENLQRENLTALDEAGSFAAELERRKKLDGKFSPDDLAKEVGISRAAMYERLTLTKLLAPARKAVVEGKISASVACKVAMVPTPDAQNDLLKKITNVDDWHYPYSVRDVVEMIDRSYVKQLSEAPFDPKLTYGDSITGIIDACTNCPHRTGNMVAAYPELKSKPNVCTKTDCFASKSKLFWSAKAQKSREAGKTVMSEKEFAEVAKQHVSSDDYCKATDGDYYTSWNKAVGRKAPEPVIVITDKGLKEYFPKLEAVAAAKRNGVKFDADDTSAMTPEQKKKAKEKSDAEAAKLKLKKDASTFIAGIASAKIEKMPWNKENEQAFWKIVFSRMEYDSLENWDSVANRRGLKGAGLAGVTKELTVAQSRSFILECLAGDYNGEFTDREGYTDEFKAFCKFAGVDIKEEEEKFLQEQQPALPLPAKTKKQGELLDVPKNAKEKVAAAARARWAKIKAAKA